MKIKLIIKRYTALLIAVLYVVSNYIPAYATSSNTSSINRFNVVVVLDASNSMNYTDPTGLRYEAISQFTNLLAEKGNYLGGIVFSNHVEVEQSPQVVSTQADKGHVTDLLKSVMSTGVTEDMGYTNIGEALSTAVDLLNTKGNADLPSVIVFLSDGNTEMPTAEEQAVSLDQKADAIQSARENNISIYTVCLNANNKADISEMKQISQATGGEFQEASNAEDLQDVFNTFYSLIYGTSTINLIDDIFPANGVLETEFEVPGMGVEEVNIVINGTTTNASLISPDGSDANASIVSSNMYTLIKMTDIVPGKWKLITEGIPGDNIKVNMIYNTNLGIDVQTDPEEYPISADEMLTVRALLRSGSSSVNTADQYVGYNAELHIMDVYGAEIDKVVMNVADNHFEAEYRLAEGTYFLNVHVGGYYLEKTSSDIGPIIVSASGGSGIGEDNRSNENTVPEPVATPVKKSVKIWPFKGGSISVDMNTLATDKQDKQLVYKIVSSSFIEGTDYTINDNVIILNHFSLSKGSFDIKATDTGGLSCNVELIVVSYNVGVMALVGIAMAGLAVLLVMGILLYIALTKPFRGTISVQSYCNGTYRGTPRTPKRGRCKLSAFGLDNTGLNYSKSYVQATGQPYVYLITDVLVNWNGQQTNKVRIQSGAEVTIVVNEGDSRLLYVRFDSRMQGKSHTTRKKSQAKRR